MERLVEGWMIGYPLLRPWLHAASVALLLCLGVLVGASLATGRPGPAARLEGQGPLTRRDGLWLAVLLAACGGLWVATR